MAKDISGTFKNLSRDQLLNVGRVSALPTTDTDFGNAFKVDPAAALASKGIHLSDAEATKLQGEIQRMGARGGLNAETEIEVSVKVKF